MRCPLEGPAAQRPAADTGRQSQVIGVVEIAVVILCALAAAATSIVVCVRSGVVMGRMGFHHRSSEPKTFWMFVIFWAFCASAFGLAVSANFIVTVFGPN